MNKSEMLEEAEKHRQTLDAKGGYLLFNIDKIPILWQAKKYPPSVCKPESFMSGPDGDLYKATGGNDYDGAEKWDLIEGDEL